MEDGGGVGERGRGRGGVEKGEGRSRGGDYSLGRQISHVTPNRLVYLCMLGHDVYLPQKYRGFFRLVKYQPGCQIKGDQCNGTWWEENDC